MVPIVRACVRPLVRMIVFIMGSQMGKSASFLNVIGHRLDDDPAPVMYIGPTQSNIDNVIEPKIMEMLQSVPSLWDKTAKGKKNTKHHKRVAGVSLRLAWAGSTTELASDSAAFTMVDELDRMEQDVKGEGSPVELADARTGTYPDGKVGITSTPTVGEVTTEIHPRTGLEHWGLSESIKSPIWKLWQEGSRHEWAVPCPDCLEFFVPRFKQLSWSENATPALAEETAGLACPHCGVVHRDDAKTWMNARGVYVAPGQKPALLDGETGVRIVDMDTGDVYEIEFGDFVAPPWSRKNITFWASGVMAFSAKKTFGYLAGKFIRAVRSGDQERIQGVINTDFGELFSMRGDAPAWEAVADLREGYAFRDVPLGVQRITIGVDVQKNRLVYAVRGWGSNHESWLIEHGELYGETEYDAVWNDLAQLLNTEWGDQPVALMVIDSGYRPGDKFKRPVNQVYQFCRRFLGRAIPSKGHDTQDKPYKPSKIDDKTNLQLWHLNSDFFKAWVHARLQWPAGEPGAWHLPQDTTDDYCQQLVAEQRVVKPSGAATWIKLRKDNHYLDCEALNVAAAHILRLHTLRAIPGQPVGKHQVAVAPAAAMQQEASQPKRPARRVSRSSIMGR